MCATLSLPRETPQPSSEEAEENFPPLGFTNLVNAGFLQVQQLWYGEMSFYPFPLPDGWRFTFEFMRNDTTRKFAGRRTSGV